MGWLGWLRASWTYTVLLLSELDNAVQDIQQTFPVGEMVCGGVTCACPGATEQLAEFCLPSCSCLGYDPSLTPHQVLAMVPLPIVLEQPGWAGNSYQPMGF